MPAKPLTDAISQATAWLLRAWRALKSHAVDNDAPRSTQVSCSYHCKHDSLRLNEPIQLVVYPYRQLLWAPV